MAAELTTRKGETAAHLRLKRLALIWAQAHGYAACAIEVCLPHCRYRADVAALRADRDGDRTAIFECKQAMSDLRRDNCHGENARTELELLRHRREVIERNLRVHYPTLRTGETLFPDFDAWDFSQLEHHGYSRVLRGRAALEQRLISCTKFEKLARYHCANLFYLVVAEPLHDLEFEMPSGWGLLVENGNALKLVQKPCWHEIATAARLRFLRRVAAAATRAINRQLAISREEIETTRESI